MPISQAEVCSQRGRTYISNIDEALAHHHVRVRRSNYQQAEIKKFLGAIRTPAAARSMSTPGIEQYSIQGRKASATLVPAGAGEARGERQYPEGAAVGALIPYCLGRFVASLNLMPLSMKNSEAIVSEAAHRKFEASRSFCAGCDS